MRSNNEALLKELVWVVAGGNSLSQLLERVEFNVICGDTYSTQIGEGVT